MSAKTLSLVLTYIVSLIVLLPALICLWKWKTLSNPIKRYGILLIFSAIIYLAMIVLTNLKINNIFLTHLLIIVDLIGMTYFFNILLSNTILKKVIVISAIVMLIWIIYDIVVNTGIRSYNSVIATVETLFVVILAGLYLFQTIIINKEIKKALLIIVGAIFVIYSFSTLIWAYSERLLKEAPEVYMRFADANNFVAIIGYLTIAYAILKKNNNKREYSLD